MRISYCRLLPVRKPVGRNCQRWCKRRALALDRGGLWGARGHIHHEAERHYNLLRVRADRQRHDVVFVSVVNRPAILVILGVEIIVYVILTLRLSVYRLDRRGRPGLIGRPLLFPAVLLSSNYSWAGRKFLFLVWFWLLLTVATAFWLLPILMGIEERGP